MNFVAKLPYDIIVEIYTYNVQHRPTFAPTLAKIPLVACKRRIYAIKDIYYKEQHDRHVHGIDLTSYLVKYVDDPNHILHHLSKCDCCDRHSNVRPSDLHTNWFLAFGFSCVPKPPKCGCQCDCRHLSRWIYATFAEHDTPMPYN